MAERRKVSGSTKANDKANEWNMNWKELHSQLFLRHFLTNFDYIASFDTAQKSPFGSFPRIVTNQAHSQVDDE